MSPVCPVDQPMQWVVPRGSFFDKIRNRSRIVRGRAKQKAGRATSNRRLQADGLADRIAGNARQFGEELKDAGKDIRRTLER
jgi:uncharacterized protein YjbJ (UPF0337 family)